MIVLGAYLLSNDMHISTGFVQLLYWRTGGQVNKRQTWQSESVIDLLGSQHSSEIN